MEEKNDQGEKKVDEVILPGFRFHPTDEELVGFYLKRKIQQRPLSIELIKQLDIYKYDPWDLPKFATTGEKEWYFYCPRDRKYRNSTRPNRVTGSGFWKATGTDRPIYTSEGNKCIGLKKSLVFYKGRAAKGVKTDWMMHEFRLPSFSDPVSSKRCTNRNFPASDAWAICRIFKKTSPVTPRTHSWASPCLPNPTTTKNSCFSPHYNFTKTPTSPPLQLPNSNFNNGLDNIIQSPNTFSSYLDIPTFKTLYPTINHPIYKTTPNDHHLLQNMIPSFLDLPPSYILPQLEEQSEPSNSNVDISSMLLNMSSTFNMDFGVETNNIDGQCHGFPPCTLSQDHHDLNSDDYHGYQTDLMPNLDNIVHLDDNDYHNKCGGIETVGSIPIGELLPLALPEAWKSSPPFLWDCAPLS